MRKTVVASCILCCEYVFHRFFKLCGSSRGLWRDFFRVRAIMGANLREAC